VRQLDAEPARGTENGLACADVDLAIVDGESGGLGAFRAHVPISPNVPTPSLRFTRASAFLRKRMDCRINPGNGD
jgi:hypothetical protein